MKYSSTNKLPNETVDERPEIHTARAFDFYYLTLRSTTAEMNFNYSKERKKCKGFRAKEKLTKSRKLRYSYIGKTKNRFDGVNMIWVCISID